MEEHAWKACVGETLPWVSIPLSPPIFPALHHDGVLRVPYKIDETASSRPAALNGLSRNASSADTTAKNTPTLLGRPSHTFSANPSVSRILPHAHYRNPRTLDFRERPVRYRPPPAFVAITSPVGRISTTVGSSGDHRVGAKPFAPARVGCHNRPKPDGGRRWSPAPLALGSQQSLDKLAGHWRYPPDLGRRTSPTTGA